MFVCLAGVCKNVTTPYIKNSFAVAPVYYSTCFFLVSHSKRHSVQFVC